ncbi:MAG TPA: hypothetical protein VFU81_11970 [Thermomicrobiales bacterium]|nr:hypothetical protein [Thermomicrobiales bacterium]
MDFVVVGFGIGSICILAGLVLRDAPSWWSRLPGRRPATADDARTARLCRALGNVLLVCGIVLSAVTLIVLFTGFSDGVGALLVASVVTIIAIAIVAWAMYWRQRNPPSRRPVAAAALTAAPLPLAVAIERGAARNRAAADVEIDETVEASGLTVERTVVAQERGEAPELTAEAEVAADEADERATGVHRADAAPSSEAPAPDAGGDDEHRDHHAGASAGFGHDAATFNGGRPASHDVAAPPSAAHAAAPADKPRDA